MYITHSNTDETIEAEPRPALTIDPQKFEAALDHLELSPEERDAYLDTVWAIIVGIIALGHPVKSEDCCGEPTDPGDCDTAAAKDLVGSMRLITARFHHTTAPHAAAELEDS